MRIFQTRSSNLPLPHNLRPLANGDVQLGAEALKKDLLMESNKAVEIILSGYHQNTSGHSMPDVGAYEVSGSGDGARDYLKALSSVDLVMKEWYGPFGDTYSDVFIYIRLASRTSYWFNPVQRCSQPAT